MLRSRNPSVNDIDAVLLPAGDTEPGTVATKLRWPRGVFSLSHIAVPFRSDDLVYGDGSARQAGSPALSLGALAPRGEAGVLTLTPTYFLRARHNPFHAYQAQHGQLRPQFALEPATPPGFKKSFRQFG